MITQDVPASLWLTANGREHWAKRASRTKVLRWHARVLALDAIHTEGVRFRRADVLATIHYPTRRRQDPANASPTVKAMIDGCVDAGLLPDEPSGKPGFYRITLTFTGEPL
jgi:crossover junction endodeoxyribonuclease RusA